MGSIFSKKEIIVNQDLIDLTQNFSAAAVLSDLICFFKSEEYQTFSLLSQGKTWIERSYFNWNSRLYLSTKVIDRLLKDLREKELIQTKLFKVNQAPRLHISLTEKSLSLSINRTYKNEIASELKEDFIHSRDPIFSFSPRPILPKEIERYQAPASDSSQRDLSHLGKSYINSKSSSIYSTTYITNNKDFNNLEKIKICLSTEQKEVLKQLEATHLPWEEKSKYLQRYFNKDHLQILLYLEDCPINWEQKIQLLSFKPQQVLQGILRTKQSKIKKTFMHCLMHACIHGLEPYETQSTASSLNSNQQKDLLNSYKQVAETLEKLLENTSFQGKVKAHDYYAYCDFRNTNFSSPIQANISYFDRRYLYLMENFYLFTEKELNNSELVTRFKKTLSNCKSINNREQREELVI